MKGELERRIPQQTERGSGNAFFDELDSLLGERPNTPTFHGFRDKIALTEAQARDALLKDGGYELTLPEASEFGWGTPDADIDALRIDAKIKERSSKPVIGQE